MYFALILSRSLAILPPLGLGSSTQSQYFGRGRGGGNGHGLAGDRGAVSAVVNAGGGEEPKSIAVLTPSTGTVNEEQELGGLKVSFVRLNAVCTTVSNDKSQACGVFTFLALNASWFVCFQLVLTFEDLGAKLATCCTYNTNVPVGACSSLFCILSIDCVVLDRRISSNPCPFLLSFVVSMDMIRAISLFLVSRLIASASKGTAKKITSGSGLCQ